MLGRERGCEHRGSDSTRKRLPAFEMFFTSEFQLTVEMHDLTTGMQDLYTVSLTMTTERSDNEGKAQIMHRGGVKAR